MWRHLLARDVGDDEASISTTEEDELIRHNSNGFIGWLIFHTAKIGGLCRRQLFYHTFVAHYFGLSREGIDTLSRYGYTLPIRSFDDNREDILLDNLTKTRYIRNK